MPIARGYVELLAVAPRQPAKNKGRALSPPVPSRDEDELRHPWGPSEALTDPAAGPGRPCPNTAHLLPRAITDMKTQALSYMWVLDGRGGKRMSELGKEYTRQGAIVGQTLLAIRKHCQRVVSFEVRQLLLLLA